MCYNNNTLQTDLTKVKQDNQQLIKQNQDYIIKIN